MAQTMEARRRSTTAREPRAVNRRGIPVKFWFKRDDEIELRSGNKNDTPVRTRQAKAIGVVRHIIRKAPRWED